LQLFKHPFERHKEIMSAPDTVPELVAIEGFASPATGVVGVVRAHDGVILRYARWQPLGKRPSRGTVLVVQGRAEFIERYYEVVADLRKRGFTVLTFDWRGQGGSQRLIKGGNPRKGHVRRFSDYRLDLAAIFAGPMASSPKPHFVLAHSMGAALCLEAASRGNLPVSRLVAIAPMLGLTMVGNQTIARLTATLFDALGFARAFPPGCGETAISTKPFEGNRLTRDPVRYTRKATLSHAAFHLAIGDPTFRWVTEAFRFMRRMGDPQIPLSVKLPTMVIAAGADGVVSTPAVMRFTARLKTGPGIVIPGARHEILNEIDEARDAFWAAFDAFIPGEVVSGEALENQFMQRHIA
jgi:lysophospholipase